MVSIPVFYVYREPLFSALIALDKAAQAALSRALLSLLEHLMLALTLVLDPSIITQAFPEGIIRFNEEVRKFDLKRVCFSLGYYLLLSLQYVLPKVINSVFGFINKEDLDLVESTSSNINIWEDPLNATRKWMSAIFWSVIWSQLYSLVFFFASLLVSAAPFFFTGLYVFAIYKILVTPPIKKVNKVNPAIIVDIYLDINETKSDFVIRVEPGSITEQKYSKKNGLKLLPPL